MANELIRPIDADSAHAIEEASKAASKAIEAAMQTGKYVGAVLGDLPHDLVGIIGDWVAHKRARRWAELQAETEKILRERGVENRENVSPSVAIPLIAAAVNEDREGLKQMWAKLLAAALDPSRASRVRPLIIATQTDGPNRRAGYERSGEEPRRQLDTKRTRLYEIGTSRLRRKKFLFLSTS